MNQNTKYPRSVCVTVYVSKKRDVVFPVPGKTICIFEVIILTKKINIFFINFCQAQAKLQLSRAELGIILALVHISCCSLYAPV